MPTKKSTDIAVQPQNLPGKMGEMMSMANILAKSGVVPASYAGRPEAIFAVVQYGKEFGIPPMTALQNMAFINGKPSMGTDLLAALAHRHPEWAGYTVLTYTEQKCEVVVRRLPKGAKTPVEFKGSFTIDEARAAGLIKAGGAWDKWKRRMLKHRAMSFALRDAFPDILAGTYTYEEMEPDRFAANQDIEMRVLDEVEASILEDRAIPAEAQEVKAEAPRVSKTSTNGKSTERVPARRRSAK